VVKHALLALLHSWRASCAQLSHSPAAAAVLALLSGSLADLESVAPSPHTAPSVPPTSVFPPPDSLAPAVTDRKVRVQSSPNCLKGEHNPFTSTCPKPCEQSLFWMTADGFKTSSTPTVSSREPTYRIHDLVFMLVDDDGAHTFLRVPTRQLFSVLIVSSNFNPKNAIIRKQINK